MSDRPDSKTNLWRPPENPNAWRTMSKPTRQRRRVTLRPTLPNNVPDEPASMGGWHLPIREDTTARPAPLTASPEMIALGIVPDVEETPRPEDTATESQPLRPEDMALETGSETDTSATRPEDTVLDTPPDEDATEMDVMLDTDISDESLNDALEKLEDDDESAFTIGELLALQQLADEATDSDMTEGESFELDVVDSDDESEFNTEGLSLAERAALGLEPEDDGETQEAELEPTQSTGFDYSSQIAALQSDAPATADAPAAATSETGADQFDYSSQIAALQGGTGDVAYNPYDETQSFDNTPSMAPVDPQLEALAQQFANTEQQVRSLRVQRDNGQLSQQQFESALRELMVFDERESVWWMMGADTEIWYKYDNNSGQWIVAEPPRTAAASQQREQNIMTPDSGMREVGDLSGSLPQVGSQDTEWGYSQRGEPVAEPSYEDSYKMPQPAAPRDEQATMVGNAAYLDQLPNAAETVPNQQVVEADYDTVEPPLEMGADDSGAPDYEAAMGANLESEIELAQRRRNRQIVTTIAAIVGVVTGVMLLAAAGIIFYVYSQYQGIKQQWEGNIAGFGQFETGFQTVVILDVNGNEIARLRSEEGGDRTNVSLQNVSPHMIHAVVATENERFFTDSGWDPIAITRAFMSNLVAGDVVSGGSTITQQLARNLILRDSNVNFATEAQRKLHEIVISHELAQRYGKDRILEVYLNEVYFGNQKYGVEAASEFYFNKPAAELNLAESALIAGLIQAPAATDPVTNPGAAFDRLDNVVRLMVQAGCLPIPYQSGDFCINSQTLEGEAAIEIAQVKTTVYLPEETSVAYPHFVTFVQQQLQSRYSQEEIFRRGFIVRTTLRPEVQDNAQNSLSRYVEQIGTTGVNTGTVMVTNPDSGAIIALVGSPDFNDETIDGQVNLALSWQQPGSAIKPIVYATAFGGVVTDAGPRYLTPASILWDVPTTYGDTANTVIRNFDGTYRGPVSARSALQNSYNVPAVKVMNFIGVNNFQQQALAMGFRFLDAAEFNLTTALGSTDVRLYDMMEAYGTIANDGTLVPLYAIEEITDAAGNPVTWEREQPVQAIQPATAFLMQNVMSDDAARVPAFGANNRLSYSQYPGQVAAKTGTSNDNRDLWTMGFTDDVVVGVWLGHVDNNPTFNTSGYLTASPLWREVMDNVLNVTRPPSAWDVPAGIIQTQYCVTTGTQVDPSGQIPCNDVRTGYFISNQLPPPASEGFITQVTINTWTQQIANDFCPNDTQQFTAFDIDDSTAEAWLRDNPSGQQLAQQLGLSQVMFAPTTACDANTQILQAGINSPAGGSVVTQPVIQVNGSISSAANFSSYDLQVAPANNPNQFTIVDGPYTTLPVGQQLGTWDATNAADGQYIIRLAINNSNSGYAYRDINITLDKPEPTPTPTPLPIPTAPPIGSGGGNGGAPGQPTPTFLPFDNQGLSVPTPTATLDFGG